MAELPPIERGEDVVLQAIKVAAQGKLGPQVGHDLEVLSHVEAMTGAMVIQLRTFLYAEKVAHDEQSATFSKTVPYDDEHEMTIELQTERDVAVGFVIVLGVLATLAALFGAWYAVPVVTIAVAVAVTAAITDRRDVHVAKGEVTVSGKVTIPASHYMTYPDNPRVVEGFGKPMRVIQYSAPLWNFDQEGK